MPESVRPVDLWSTVADAVAMASVLIRPPALTRLEPQSVSGDPAPGAVAAVADPLWMLGRQWQLGELLGEDAGTPVSVTVRSRSLPVTAWAPGTDDDAAWRPWPEGALLDELVQDVPGVAGEDRLRWRAETGAQLADELREAGLDGLLPDLLAAHPLTLAADPVERSLDPTALRLHAVLAGRVPDGGSVRAALADGEPAWLTGADDPPAVRDVLAGWVAWVDGQPGSGGCWTTPRLEHRYRLRFGHGDDAVVLAAEQADSGAGRWHDYAWLPGAEVALDADAALDPPPERTATMLATRLSYPGMAADRYWQLENGAVDVGAIEAQPHDLARLCLAEFALVTGDDWLVVPLDGRVGALNQVLEVTLTTTFGERQVVAEDRDGRHGRGFLVYEVVAADGAVLPGVVLPPVAHSVLEGPPVEEVAFLRDETANMAWAVERVIPGLSGDGRPRAAERQPRRPALEGLAPGDLLYELMSPVPEHWVPLVPVARGYAEVELRKGAMLKDGVKVQARSQLLAPTPLTFPAEEIPREGVTVRAVPLVARRADGSYARWVGHRVRVGRGEGSSGLAFDAAHEPGE